MITTTSECWATRVPDIKTLHLSSKMEHEISESILLHKMDYDFWVETAEDFAGFRHSLITRGYRNIGLSEPIMNPEPVIQIVNKIPKSYKLNISNKPKNMMKRGKRN